MAKVGVVGAGPWGKNLARNFYDLRALGMICDTDSEVRRAMESLYPGVPVTDDYDEVLKNPKLDGIAIATPAASHFHLARRALLEGDKHLFVEKPLALRVEDGVELLRLAENRDQVFMVGHLLHYHPAVMRLKEMVQAGELGRIHYVHSTRLNMGRIRRNENVLWSFAPHDISLVLMLLEERPVSVRALGGNHLREDSADVSSTVLDFGSGARGYVFSSWIHPFKEQKLVVVGEKAMAVFNDVEGEKLQIFEHKVHWEAGSPFVERGLAHTVAVGDRQPLENQCRHFLEAMSNGSLPRTNGREAIQVICVLDACQRSMDREGEPTAVRWLDEEVNAPSDSAPTFEAPFVHQTAVIDPGASIGAGTRIWHFAHVLGGTRIGAGCVLGQNVMAGPNVTIGNRCKIQNNVSIYQGVTLEDDVFCGPSAVFTNVRNPRSAIPRMDQLQQTLVRKGGTIGANATIVCGVEIGRYAFVGAGAVVTRNVPDFGLVVGNPARRVGWMCACGERLPSDLRCASCGKAYRKSDQGIVPSTSVVTDP